MNFNNSSQYMLFTIHFKGSKFKNFLGVLPRIYNYYKGGKFYYFYVNDFIYKKIYTIFDPRTIGEIVYERISNTEFYILKKDVPQFETLFENELYNVTRDVSKNNLGTSQPK